MKRFKKLLTVLATSGFVALTACGGLKGHMIPKSSIPAHIDSGVKMEIERLYSSSSSEREKGAHNLGVIGKEAAPAVPFLIDLLKDKSDDVRWKSAEALGKIGDLRAVEPLIAALKDKDDEVRRSVAWALGKIGDPRAVEPLIIALNIALKDDDENVQLNAAIALGNIKDPRAVEPLIAALKLIGESSDEEKLSGKNAAWALGKIGDPRAIEPLISAMKDEEKGVRGKAVGKYVFGGLAMMFGSGEGASAMGQATNSLVAMKERDMGIRWSVAWALADIGRPAIEPLIAILKDKNADEIVRRRSAVALGRIGDPIAMEPLIIALKDKDEDVRLSAAAALGNMKDPHTTEPLLAALKDKDENVRGSAAIALGKIGGSRAIDPLIALLKDENKNLRWSAAIALGNIKDPRAVDPLIAFLKELPAELKNEHWIVRKAVAERLGMIGKPAVDPLITFLKDEDNEVRLSAAEALGKIKDSRAVEPLIAILKGTPQIAWINDKVRVDIRVATAIALGNIGDSRAVEPLIAVLNDKNNSLRKSAAIALGNIGDSRAVEPLIAVLKDENIYVRKSAKEALVKISGNNLGYDHAKWQEWWVQSRSGQPLTTLK